MLPPFIIDQIRKREQGNQQRKQQPMLEIPLPPPTTRSDHADDDEADGDEAEENDAEGNDVENNEQEEDQERGVYIVNLR